MNFFLLPAWAEESVQEDKKEDVLTQSGYASWYGGKFHGRTTASGEVFDKNELTAAHRRLPFGTIVKVTNTANDESVTVRITDRGPFVEGRIIDLSRAAAEKIGLIRAGVAEVRIEVIESPGEDRAGLSGGSTDSSGNSSNSSGNPSENSTSTSRASLDSERLDTGKAYQDPRDNPLYTFAEPESYTVQIASFSREDNAKRLYSILQEDGLSPSYEKSPSGHYRVVITGVEPDKLEDVKEQLSNLGHTSLLIREVLY
ncbi:MAG: septal ring lytic transglycosylase RlpA family protein [Spirochaetaceae bacterium]